MTPSLRHSPLRTNVVRTAALLALTVATAGAQEVVGRRETTWTLREALASGQKLHITSPNGAISIAQGGGSQVEITAEKKAGDDTRIEDIGFVVKRSDEGLVVCAVRSDDDQCDMEEGYRQGGRRWRNGWNNTRVSFTVRIPAGIRVQTESGNGDITINGAGASVNARTGNGRMLISGTTGRVSAETGNGRITVDDARGPVRVSTGNGSVHVATSSGPVTARSGNGDIDVSMARVERASEMEFHTGSGRISLSVPSGFGAELESSTGNGEITSELPMRVEGRINPHRLRGTLGDGGERLAISTGNGDITIRKAR